MKSTNLPVQFLHDLHKQWHLYPKQAEVAQKIFRDKKRLGFLQWGRKAAKTTTGLYVLARAANTNPNTIYYWFAPKAKQAREIIWASGRLQNFVPKKYVKKIKETEMRVIYWNDSFIKLDGSDEYEQYRGVECDGALYDEVKDFDHRFDAGFRPNLGPRKAFLIASGTPPRRAVTLGEQKYFALRNEFANDPLGFYLECPSWSREDPEWLQEIERIREQYRFRAEAGDADAWNEFRCEYGGEYIKGGPGSIFPMFDKSKHVRPRSEILSEIRSFLPDCEFYCVADPGSAECFAVGFFIADPKRGRVYLIDEIYEKNQGESAVTQIIPRIDEKIRHIWPAPHLWNYIYDEAALWFKVNMMANFEDPGWRPTQKSMYRERSRDMKPFIGYIKDGFINNSFTIAAECPNIINEIEAYAFDENGNIPKKNDHGIDLTRYFFGETLFEFTYKHVVAEEDEPAMPRRFYSVEPAAEPEIEVPELDLLVW